MLGSLVRTVVLRYVRSLLNLQVEKLALWTGVLTLENVVLNAEEATKNLQLPGIHLISGSIARLEMNVPWTNLLEESVSIDIRGLAVHVQVREGEIPGEMKSMSQEDSLLLTVLSNLRVRIEGVSVTAEFQWGAKYLASIRIGSVHVQPVNSDGEVGFRSPVLETGSIEVIRTIAWEDMQVRIATGPPDSYLSSATVNHLYENQDCKVCGLCQAFSLSHYTLLLRLLPWTGRLLLGYQLTPAVTSLWADITSPLPLHLHTSLTDQPRLHTDLSHLKTTLFPTRNSGNFVSVVSLSLPVLSLRIKTYNPTSLQFGHIEILTNQLNLRLLLGHDMSAEGSAQSFTLLVHPHQVKFTLPTLRYGLNLHKSIFSSEGLEAFCGSEVIISVPKLAGELIFTPKIRVKTSLNSVSSDMNLTDMFALFAAISDLRLFYLRWWEEKSLIPSVDAILKEEEWGDEGLTVESVRAELVKVMYRYLEVCEEVKGIRRMNGEGEEKVLVEGEKAEFMDKECTVAVTNRRIYVQTTEGHTLLSLSTDTISSAEASSPTTLLLTLHNHSSIYLTVPNPDPLLSTLHTLLR